MSFTLSITDNEDGTGGVATVAGVAALATVNVYWLSWDGTAGAHSWTLLGTRTGPGTLAAALPVGLYQWQALSSLAGVADFSGLVYQPLTGDESATHAAILSTVKTTIDSLALDGLPALKTMRKWVPRAADSAEQLPLCIISPLGSESYGQGLNAQDDVGYPVVVAILDKLQGDPVANLARDLLWRQKIQKAFRMQRLPGVPTVWICDVQPGPIVDPTAYEAGYLASIIVLRFTSRETRGLT